MNKHVRYYAQVTIGLLIIESLVVLVHNIVEALDAEQTVATIDLVYPAIQLITMVRQIHVYLLDPVIQLSSYLLELIQLFLDISGTHVCCVLLSQNYQLRCYLHDTFDECDSGDRRIKIPTHFGD